MSWLSELMGGLASGGVTTVISGVVGAVAKYKETQLNYEHETKRWSYEVDMQRLQIEADQKLADQNLLISKQQGADTAFNSAIQAEGAISHTGLPWWVGAIRTLFRPWLTAYLWISITVIALVQIIWFQNVVLPSSADAIISSMNAGATAALGFWFGQRLIGNSPQR